MVLYSLDFQQLMLSRNNTAICPEKSAPQARARLTASLLHRLTALNP